MSRVISREVARRFLLAHHGLRGREFAPGAPGVRALLARLRCIQLDPLDAVGTNADLVALARVDAVARGDVYRHLLPTHAFEHFAKERCLLPATAFAHYRAQAVETPWWRLGERLKRLEPGVLERVLDEVRARGPVSAAGLTDQGRVEALDWSGWKSTGRVTSMALEVLWTRCQVVVAGRGPRGVRRYDVPERALPDHHDAQAEVPFATWALGERVEAAGLLPCASGPWWSMLSSLRNGPEVEALVGAGTLESVTVEGANARYLASAGFLDRLEALEAAVEPDDTLRVLGPLDPMLWCRALVHHVFDFEYVWEVYKPAAQRRWGWYVCPLLHRGRLVGRFEGHTEEGEVVVDTLWTEPGVRLDRRAFKRALERLRLPERKSA